MDSYRHMLYRYSTGFGPSMNVDMPANASDYASFKMKPLLPNLGTSEQVIDLRREADRVSMQAEAAEQIIKVMGYNSAAGKSHRELKSRVDLIRHLMSNYPIRFVRPQDMETLYSMYAKNSPGMDALIEKVVQENKGISDVNEFIKTAQRVRKGYPLFDQFGKKLAPVEAKQMTTLEGLETITGNPLLIVGILLTAYALWAR